MVYGQPFSPAPGRSRAAKTPAPTLARAAAPVLAAMDGAPHRPRHAGGFQSLADLGIRVREFRGDLSETATRIHQLSVERWGGEKAVELVGRDSRFLAMLSRLEKFARFNEPILITGESGVGKELIAKACHLLSWRVAHPFVSVNCPQFHDSNTTVSELFGHRRGSFTGATADHQGLFETAGEGVLFLDEIGDLPLCSQVLLLRALAEGEFKPLGAVETQKFHARFITATNQPLSERMNAKEFREDLFFRLRYFRLEIPPLRERGDDWLLLLNHYLGRLNAQHLTRKRFSDEALRALAAYRWPGNVRELRGIVSMGFSLSEGDEIHLADFQAELGAEPSRAAPAAAARDIQRADPEEEKSAGLEAAYAALIEGRTSFWENIHADFMERELNREQVKAIIDRGLRESRGSYRRLCGLFRIDAEDYHKFMDFLRHHRLKPDL